MFKLQRKKDIDFDNIIGSDFEVHSRFEALRIAIIYGIVGTLWVLLSEKIIGMFTNDLKVYVALSEYKGWFYVLITMVLVYKLIKKRLEIFKCVLNKLYENYDELNAANEELNAANDELTALQRELREKYDELENQRDATMKSEQRYRLISEGSNDGIWDWNLKNGRIYYSSKCEELTGYSLEELGYEPGSWHKLVLEEDREKANKKIQDYLQHKSESYENIYRIRSKDGKCKWIFSRGKAIWDEEGNATHFAGSFTDNTERIAMEKRLMALAYIDTLTGLSNRSMLEMKMDKLLALNKEQHKKLAFLDIDIDDFKHVNDTLGHYSGDLLLKNIGCILNEHIKAPDFAARLSGDEFVVIFQDITDENMVRIRTEELLEYLRKPWRYKGQEFFITFSIGIAVYPEHGENFASLLRSADTAMFNAKRKGKDNLRFYTSVMNEKMMNYIEIVKELRTAVVNEELVLFYQPQIDLKSGKIVGVEALIRWNHPQKGFIPPMEFIPLAEETKYIYEIEKWVLETAFKQKKSWEADGYKPIRMSVNLSGKSLTMDNIVDEIRELLSKYELNPKELEIEITETSVMKDLNKAMNILQQIEELGIEVSLDDFGTGYSSLTYLKKLPINDVKMDKNFIKSITVSDNNNDTIVRAVIKLAHDLGLKVVAEGIETDEQLDFLRQHTCDIGQGYLFSKPVPAEQIEEILLKG